MNLVDITRLSVEISFHFNFKCCSGTFKYQIHVSSSSQLIADYDVRYWFSLLGLGEIYDEIYLEKKDWLTEQYVRSEALMVNELWNDFYFIFFGVYDKCKCAHTGQHRFKVRTNGVNISYYDFGTLRLRGE